MSIPEATIPDLDLTNQAIAAEREAPVDLSVRDGSETGVALDSTLVESLARKDEQTPQSAGRRFVNFLGHTASSLFIAAELNPITNEGLRVAAFTAAQTATDNPYAAAGAFTLTTFAIEAGGAVATAKVMATEKSGRLIEKVNQVVNRLRIPQIVQSSPFMEATVDSAVSLVAGSPAATAFKHARSPERTERENIKYGLLSSLGISAFTGGESLLLSRSITNPNLLTISGAVAAAGLAIGGFKWAKNRLESIRATGYERYRGVVETMEKGPQAEGFSEQDFTKVTADPETKYMKLESEGKQIRWPVLTPIKNFTEFVPKYFDQHYGSNEEVRYLSVPPKELLESDPTLLPIIAKHMIEASTQGLRIVFSELDGESVQPYLIDAVHNIQPDARIAIDTFVEPKNNTDASIPHFSAHVEAALEVKAARTGQEYSADAVRAEYKRQVEAGEIDVAAASRTVLLDVDAMDAPYGNDLEKSTLDRLWKIYSGQFSWLNENHPVRDAQTYDELASMVRDPGTITVAHMVDGEIASFAMFVSNIGACDWLNPSFYAKQFPGESLLYFPGIATDRAMKGHRYSLNVVSTISKLVTDVSDRVRIVWQCTNVSEDYIPAIVQAGIAATGLAEVEEPQVMARYKYRGIDITIPSKSEA